MATHSVIRTFWTYMRRVNRMTAAVLYDQYEHIVLIRLCRKFSLEAICGMVSPDDPWHKEKESDHDGELQGGPFPQGYYPDGCALVRRVSLELSPYRRINGGARG